MCLRLAAPGVVGVLMAPVLLATLAVVQFHVRLAQPGFYRTLAGETSEYATFYDALLIQVVRGSGLPAALQATGFSVEPRDLADVVAAAAPLEWMRPRLDELVDAAAPFLLGTTDAFRVTLPLADRAEPLLASVRELLLRIGVREVECRPRPSARSVPWRPTPPRTAASRIGAPSS